MKPLTGFPEEFEPLVIVTGDRREVPPKHKGDLLAYSVSSIDLMYLPLLRFEARRPGAPAPIMLSDKQFVTDRKDELRRRFGQTNILVIGSPAVNLLARQINQLSPFRFDISEQTQEELAEQESFMETFDDDPDDLFIYQQCLEGILDVEVILTRFVGLAVDLQELRKKAQRIVEGFQKSLIGRRCRDGRERPIRYLMHKLDAPGIVDPYYANVVRGRTIPSSKDYGLISVFPSPFSTSGAHHVIYVAGVHGPGTALGVKMLADGQAFAEHQFGGVYEVGINQYTTYFERIQYSKARWETRSYTDPPLPPPTRAFMAFLSSPSKREDQDQREFNARLKHLLTELFRRKGIDVRMQEPYTIPLGGGDDFWRGILEYEKQCRFVIHEVTNFARGVMVEIGFSYGSGREYFLIWNVARAPITDWTRGRPELLQVTHVEPIDLSGGQAEETLKRKIVEPVAAADPPAAPPRDPAPDPAVQPRLAYVYARSPRLNEYVRKSTRHWNVRCISEEEFPSPTRIAKIREALRVARYALIELDDADLDSFIVLGMAKATGTVTVLLMRPERHTAADFAWSDLIAPFSMDTLESDLATPLAKLLSR